MATVTEDKQVACTCRGYQRNPMTYVYRSASEADSGCERCHGSGWWTCRTSYDRDPSGGFAKVLSEALVDG